MKPEECPYYSWYDGPICNHEDAIPSVDNFIPYCEPCFEGMNECPHGQEIDHGEETLQEVADELV